MARLTVSAAARGLLLSASFVVFAGQTLLAQEFPSPFIQTIAIEAAEDEAIAAFYRENGYRTLWTGAAEQDSARRAALLQALSRAGDHALPTARYDVAKLTAMLTTAQTEGDRARAEVALTRAYLSYARDVSTGATNPKSVDPGIVREIGRPDPTLLLAQMQARNPAEVLHGLLPSSPRYAQLVRAKLALEASMDQGGWGTVVRAKSLAPGDTGDAVVALRDRLIAMGYLSRSATQSYDATIENAVQRFQLDHGLVADGAAGEGTLAELNIGPDARLKSVIVAIERVRWMHDTPLGDRHIWVNIPDFTAKIIDQGKVTFETRSVVGKDVTAQHTPEFSDMMAHMVINPSWGVPRSIIVNEYLPLLQRNPNAVSHLQVIDNRGRVVPRGSVNFAGYSSRTFPFGLRQPPSNGNALGLVKFMFPNVHNIYLHDTPAKNLFSHDVRAYSHGCIRLADPFDFAYALLALQSDDPQAEFARHLKTGNETTVRLEQKVPVHLVYFTAYPGAKGQMTYRRDIYGRDAKLFQALEAAGVVLPSVRG
ncbi:MAG: L,D-transpeptidase family protein [Pseudotabrizicola sp.]|uniref:L,D-transpeptidase family protein n=1 Tax=Pseudotabrizicola sp. TaxID=2939647 RepID=UPI0027208120|nr:L,D-transpeptidase family protein [Pseudotabrizicola sp.]MDO8883140.1 L,D-transpeptidase family protein [Pseudotabrizicola sp.]MDP2083213.1 L,D-transpeptidase family protein [Pseudotabrizicola sp.]MDZ7572630.1 L,D-transpeptidase family protein [Pseudotabrizicola sp.]